MLTLHFVAYFPAACGYAEKGNNSVCHYNFTAKEEEGKNKKEPNETCNS